MRLRPFVLDAVHFVL